MILEGIYREIIEDNPIAYLRIKYQQLNNSVEIIDMNKACKRLLSNYKVNIIDLICDNNKLKEAILNKKCSYKKYIEKDEACLNIDVYHGEKNEFHLQISNLGIDSIKVSTITSNSPFLAWIKNKEGNYLDVNDKFLEIVNKTYFEVIGKNDYEIWTQKVADINTRYDELVMNNKKQNNYKEAIEINPNKSAYFHCIKWPFRDKDEEIIGTIGIALEITDKINLQKNIEKNEKFFQEISENIDDVIIIRDREKAIYISNSFEKTFGHSPEDLYTDISIWHEDWENIKLIDGTTDYESIIPSTNTVRVRKNKFDKWLQSRFVPVLDEYGDIIKKIGIISDVTRDKKIEEKIESLRMDLFANISHEIRTPITLILSSIQILTAKLNKLNDGEKEYYCKYINIMKQNSYRLLKLVNNLIDTTRIDSGNFTYKPQNYDIISFVENICMSVSDFVDMNEMCIIFDTDEEEKIISFDLDNMERIILNLLSNAIKYNNKNGKIEVTINCKDNIKISVKDNGIGIPKNKQSRVFERFGQVKDKLKTEHEGSGIGLFLVKSLVELNGGKIFLNSELGKGSEFVIILPDKTEDSKIDSKNLQSEQYKIDRMNVEFSDIYI